LSQVGQYLGLLPQEGRDLILAVAILSILVNPLFFAALDRILPWLERRRAPFVREIPKATESPRLPRAGAGYCPR
jgi:CPA2 family monovalent cation:H+ antiporter-2